MFDRGHGHAAHRDSRRAGTVGMDEACARRAGEAMPRRVVHAVRRYRIGDEVRSHVGFDNFIRQLDRVFDRSGNRARGVVRRFLRRIHRAAVCGDASRARLVARPRLVSGARLGAERSAAAVSQPSLAVGPGVRADGAIPACGRRSTPRTTRSRERLAFSLRSRRRGSLQRRSFRRRWPRA